MWEPLRSEPCTGPQRVDSRGSRMGSELPVSGSDHVLEFRYHPRRRTVAPRVRIGALAVEIKGLRPRCGLDSAVGQFIRCI